MLSSKSVLILGAKSLLSKSIAKKFASKGYNIILAARAVESLFEFSRTLEKDNNIKCSLIEFDILKLSDHDALFDNIEYLPKIVICVVGLMTINSSNLYKSEEINLMIRTNYLMPAIFLENIAKKFLDSKSEKTIIGISSVAGDRGRASNYIYGSSKAGFTEYLSGLRQKLNKSDINVITIKPGYIKTKMSKNIQGPSFLFSSTDSVADLIYNAHLKKKLVIYTRIWKYIMLIIKIIPEGIFKKLNF